MKLMLRHASSYVEAANHVILKPLVHGEVRTRLK
jgi:hypothetical protein